jgi:hypothetical protein
LLAVAIIFVHFSSNRISGSGGIIRELTISTMGFVFPSITSCRSSQLKKLINAESFLLTVFALNPSPFGLGVLRNEIQA